VWDAATGCPVSPPVPHPDAVVHVAFSPTGGLVASCCPAFRNLANGYAFVWDAKSGVIVNRRETEGRDAQKVWFSPDGNSLWIGSATYLCEGYRLEQYNLTDTNRGGKIASCWETFDAVYSPDKKRLLIVGAFGPERFSGARVFEVNEPGAMAGAQLLDPGALRPASPL